LGYPGSQKLLGPNNNKNIRQVTIQILKQKKKCEINVTIQSGNLYVSSKVHNKNPALLNTVYLLLVPLSIIAESSE
jgi:DNA-directed RNA polymerase alpha subunit